MEAIEQYHVDDFIAEEESEIVELMNLVKTQRSFARARRTRERGEFVGSLTEVRLVEEAELTAQLEGVVQRPVEVAQKIRSLIAADIAQISIKSI